jgi:hypothetical protein
MIMPEPLKKFVDFWCKPQPTLALDLFRVFFGLLVVQYALCIAATVHDFFGPHAIVSAATARTHQQASAVTAHYNIFDAAFPLSNTDQAMTIAAWILAASALCLSLGFASNINAFIVYTLLCAFTFRNPFVRHSGHALIRILALLLVLSPVGTSVSLDSWIKRQPVGGTRRIWPQRLVQFTIAMVYFQAATSKLAGAQWLNLSGVYVATHLTGFQNHFLPLLTSYPFTQGLTALSLIVECALFTLVWFERTRYWVLLVGVIFHGCIAYVMNIPQFEELMVISYITFVEPHDIIKLGNWLRSQLWPVLRFKASRT